jgi:tRNA A37 threonylcarbamoyladenosine biosynthesis protein TsaE
VPLQHVDLYRLTPKEVDDLGLDDLLEGSVMAVEWPDRWTAAPQNAIRVRIDVLEGSRRRVAIQN